jgi:pimeloyl-ACP methyl ester carboxylesterase
MDQNASSPTGTVAALRSPPDLGDTLKDSASTGSCAALTRRGPLPTPIVFDGCFGWLHTGTGGGGDVAVMLCCGLIRDALDSHHSFRLLADRLAAAGYPTMRFDYPGTGDSCDTPDGECGVAWLRSVQNGVDWLRAATGAQRIVLCGLRIGATLAALAAEHRNDIAGLILLAPVLRGHSYIQQLRVEAQLHSGSSTSRSDGLDFQELRLSPKAVALIGGMDLRKVELTPKQPVAVFARADSRLLSECLQAWTLRGVQTACFGFDGLEPMLRHNTQGEGVPADFSEIVAWLLKAVPAQANPETVPYLPAPIRMKHPGCIETPLRFGPDDRLFGILCCPDGPGADTALIIGNTGRDPHYGPARFAVGLARRLAAEGIASLRIDFAGVGDSIGHDGKETLLSRLFEDDRTPDISAAIDALERQGYRRFGAHGVCAGAYHALHAALTDTRLETLLLINMPVFTWRDGDAIEYVARRTSSPRRYLTMLTRRRQWLLLLRGQFNVLGILRAQCARLCGLAGRAWLSSLERLGFTQPGNFARNAMAILSRRGVRTLFLVAPEDPGFDILEQNFGRGAVGLRAFEGASMKVVPGMDHMLGARHARQAAADLIVNFLKTSSAPSASATIPLLSPQPATEAAS